jgi:hypothetical protein
LIPFFASGELSSLLEYNQKNMADKGGFRNVSGETINGLPQC